MSISGSLIPLFLLVGILLLCGHDASGQVSTTDPPRAGASPASVQPLGAGESQQPPLSVDQCARLRDKVARDASLTSTYSEQLKWCNAHSYVGDSSESGSERLAKTPNVHSEEPSTPLIKRQHH